MTAPEADLTGWTAAPFSAAGYTYDVYRKGEGPGVVLIPEMPGIHPGVLALGNHLVDNGFTVACPSLYGTPGAPGIRPGAVPVMLRGCVAKEFAAFATNADRPIAHYLRALARDLNEKTPGKGVGVIGECWSGGFALAAAVDDSVLAPVLSQPSLPMPIGAARPAQLGLDAADLAAVKERTQDGLRVLGLRFSEDPVCRGERFDTLRRELGDGFESIEIDSSEGNPNDIPKTSHSVLTLHLVDEPGHPTREALDRVMSFLGERLRE